MSSKGKLGKKASKQEPKAEERERIETQSLMTIFRQDKILSIEKDRENNLYVRARKRPETLDEEAARWETIQFKLSDQEAALLALKLFSVLVRGDDNGG